MGERRAEGTLGAIAEAVPGLPASTEPPDRVFYSRDLWPRRHIGVRAGHPAECLPAGVVWPRSTEEVARVLAWASREGVPVVPFGAGSGVCAGVDPNERTLVLDLKRLNRVRRLDRDAPAVEVEAGYLGNTLEDALNRDGLTLGHFPSSIMCSTAGGWVATRSGGQCSSAYGKIEDMVVALECVTGDGRVRTLRSRDGLEDLVPLVVGSEGTLAVVTSATFRLHPAPTVRSFGSWSFGSLDEGIVALRRVMQAGLRPAVARLYDPFDAMLARRAHGASDAAPPRRTDSPPSRRSASPLRERALRALLSRPAAVNRWLGSRWGARALGGALLVLIFDGRDRRAEDDLAVARSIAGGTWAGEGPARHWLERRYSVSFRQAGVFSSGGFVDTMEVAAPWSRIPRLYEGVRRALGEHAFVMAHFSHAYPDGCCIYFSFAGAADGGSARALGWDRACAATYDRAWRAAIAATIEAGGTVSHHHGIGRSKAGHARAELASETSVFADLARAFDPAGILNPGNLGVTKSGTPRPPATAPREASPETSIDRESLLVAAPGAATLRDVERAANAAGLTLGVADPPGAGETVAAWLERGAPGLRDRWLDPADHELAGIEARLADGRPIRIRPAPRRAMGPDLSSLFVGMGGRFGAIDRAWLRLHRAGAVRPTAAPFAWDHRPAPNDGERELLDAIARALQR
jgi:alkyldihydroxyacetonephosphate synthase